MFQSLRHIEKTFLIFLYWHFSLRTGSRRIAETSHPFITRLQNQTNIWNAYIILHFYLCTVSQILPLQQFSISIISQTVEPDELLSKSDLCETTTRLLIMGFLFALLNFRVRTKMIPNSTTTTTPNNVIPTKRPLPLVLSSWLWW